VVVDGYRERPLGRLLADHVFVQDRVDLLRLWQAVEVQARIARSGRDQFLIDDLVAEVDAFVADVDPGAGDQLLDLTL
jgi:hypothetical protein